MKPGQTLKSADTHYSDHRQGDILTAKQTKYYAAARPDMFHLFTLYLFVLVLSIIILYLEQLSHLTQLNVYVL
jgi:hypothetical protein